MHFRAGAALLRACATQPPPVRHDLGHSGGGVRTTTGSDDLRRTMGHGGYDEEDGR
jgi:hypothetical protein